MLSQYIDVLAVRTFSHATVDDLARSATIPVINALSDASHPCQAMADLLTIEELRGPSPGRKLAFVGDGNNVARSLATAAALLGVDFVLAAPPGYEFPPDFQARFAARFPAVPLVIEHDPKKAVRVPMSFTLTSGRAWDRSTRPKPDAAFSPRTRSIVT